MNKELLLNYFIDNKYTKWYFNIIDKIQKERPTKKIAKELCEYIESHHIIPVSINNELRLDKSNLVHCTPREHFILHKLLIKMVVGGTSTYRDMCYAIHFFIKHNKTGKINLSSRDFEYIKKISSLAGKNSPSYVTGKKRIHKDNVNKFVTLEDLDTYLNNGWILGCSEESYKNCTGFAGKHHTEEAKKKQSKNNARANLGKNFTEEHKNKLRKPKSEEARLNMSIAQKSSKANKGKNNTKSKKVTNGEVCFYSASEASLFYNRCKTAVSYAIYYNHKCAGYKWFYIDESVLSSLG